MKRFFCTVCKRIKRTQKLPSRIENQHSDNPTLRLGVCNHHNKSYTVNSFKNTVSGQEFLRSFNGAK